MAADHPLQSSHLTTKNPHSHSVQKVDQLGLAFGMFSKDFTALISLLVAELSTRCICCHSNFYLRHFQVVAAHRRHFLSFSLSSPSSTDAIFQATELGEVLTTNFQTSRHLLRKYHVLLISGIFIFSKQISTNFKQVKFFQKDTFFYTFFFERSVPWRHFPEAFAIDAFSISEKKHNFYALLLLP